jgi:hypothetical protein
MVPASDAAQHLSKLGDDDPYQGAQYVNGMPVNRPPRRFLLVAHSLAYVYT